MCFVLPKKTVVKLSLNLSYSSQPICISFELVLLANKQKAGL